MQDGSITITLTAEEYELLAKSVDAKVDYYRKAVVVAKRRRKYNPHGLTARTLTTYTGIQNKFA